MRLVIASKNQKNLVPYLQAAGHDIKELLSNDLAVRICQETQADAILYFEDICEMMPHEDVLQDLVLQQHIRIILVVDRESPLITYAAAVGVKDFVFLPTEPATILEVIEHPGTSESAATLLRGSKTVTVATPPQEKESKELKAKGKPSIFKKVTNLFGLNIKSDNMQDVKASDAENTNEKAMPERDLEKTQSMEVSMKVQDIKKQSMQDMQDRKKVLCLGLDDISSQLTERIEVVSDPENAQAVISNINAFSFAPEDKYLIVLGTGTIADFTVKTARPDAYIAENIEDALAALNCGEKKESHMKAQEETPEPPKAEQSAEQSIKEKLAAMDDETKEERTYDFVEQTSKPNNLTVLPGRAGSKGHAIAFNSALYIVCPTMPGKAGDRAAAISKNVNRCAFVCAASGSMGAISLGIPAKDLICKDWRVPGSNAPLEWGDILVWPVDPYKFLKVNESPHGLIEGIKHKFRITVVDCAGDMEIVSGVSNNDGIIVLYDQVVDPATSYWLKNYAGRNVVSASVTEAINVIPAENGFVLVKGEERRISKAEE